MGDRGAVFQGAGLFARFEGVGGVWGIKRAHAKKGSAQKAGRIAYENEQSAFEISIFPSMVLE
ncbi:hypothetical protein [Bartonella sp. AU55XJBT]|uniref:hypothetical protein n=1 Tax=Bartonella sp. AU55XJBT TaxID=3019091 RepID=UPI002361DB7F|nr:hypothetical protein [Bartonella sp. AU55XJBT]